MNADDRSSVAGPTADVYAADTKEFVAPESCGESVFSLTIEAYPEPGVFSQIANLVNFANVAPERARIEKTPHGTLEFYIELADVQLTMIESICRKASQLTTVISVAHDKVE
jgi:hypothetical protein